MAFHVLILDGHPAAQRLGGALLAHYQASLPAEAVVQCIAVRDLRFDPVLHGGYGVEQAWEADVQSVAAALNACDHLVVGFPLWWGAEPAMLKALLDRLLLPGFAFRYHKQDLFWDRLLAGRSADVLVTMDTPPWYLRLIYGDPVGRRWRQQILGFCGIKPIRIHYFGPTRRGEAEKRMKGWQARLAQAADSAEGLRRGIKQDALAGLALAQKSRST